MEDHIKTSDADRPSMLGDFLDPPSWVLDLLASTWIDRSHQLGLQFLSDQPLIFLRSEGSVADDMRDRELRIALHKSPQEGFQKFTVLSFPPVHEPIDGQI